MTSFFRYPGENIPPVVPPDPDIPPDAPRVADYGSVILETDVDRDVLAILYVWMPTYLYQMESERGLEPGFLERPKPASYQNALEDDSFPANFLPMIIVQTAQTDGEPEQTPEGCNAAWRIVVSSAARGRSPAETRELAAMYGGTCRRILRQQGVELAGGVRWVGSSIVPQPQSTDTKGRYLAISYNQFTVYTDNALTGDGPTYIGPYPPGDPGNPTSPYDPLVKVTKVTTTINAR